jgi:cytochrome c-type biogenesis protein CcmF
MLLGRGSWLISLGLLLAFWIGLATLMTVRERVQHFPGSIASRLAAQPRAWWGMIIAHLGVAVFVAGVTIVRGYQSERDVRMDIGDTVQLGEYRFRFDGTTEVPGPNYDATRGTVTLLKGEQVIETLHPEKRRYGSRQMPMTEAAIDSGLLGDRYVSLGEPVEGGAWSVRVYHKPFVTWIWGGCVLMALGGGLALMDRRYRYRVKATATSVAATPVAMDGSAA